MRILSLDLATRLGWACGSTEGTPVSHGVVQLPKTGEDLGWYAAAYRDWLNSALDDMEPDQIVFEMPVISADQNLTTARKLYGLCLLTELIARERKIMVTEANLSTIRKHFVGISRAPRDVPKDKRRQWIKNKVIAECQRRGFSVCGDDDADAIALLSLRLSQLSKDYSLSATTLFGKAAA